MRGRSLTLADVMRELGRLLECFPRPGHAPADIEAFARPYFDVLRGNVSAEQLIQGVTKARESDRRFFPRPGELLWIARDQKGVGPATVGDPASQWSAWVRGDWSTPCPVCGATWSRTYGGRAVIVHQHARHRALGVPCVMACDERTCIGQPVPWGDAPPPSAPADTDADAERERAAIQEEGG